jgi:hypothetical protein
MLHPRSFYSAPHFSNSTSGWWLLVRRPLLLAFVLGCTVSLITAGCLTLRLVVSAGITWGFVPLLQIASLSAIRKKRVGTTPLTSMVDLFFIGQGPWLCWLIAFGAYWSSVPAAAEFRTPTWLWIGSAAAVALWSARIDFWCFRGLLQRERNRALRDLLLQRAIAWGAGILYFGGSSLWPNLIRRLGF